VLAAFTTPAVAQIARPDAPVAASWHGRAIKDPGTLPQRVRAVWPAGWGAGPVARGTGYHRPGGSRRVREVQRRLTKLGYRPGPVDGLFGPRTEAAARWFQYKHGLDATGRIDRLTLTVLHARSTHRALPRTRAATTPQTAPAPTTTPTAPKPAATPQPDTSNGTPIAIVAILLGTALAAGLLVGSRLPRRRPATPVVGYVANGGSTAVAATAPALEQACARHDWTLVRIVQEPMTPAAGSPSAPGSCTRSARSRPAPRLAWSSPACGSSRHACRISRR
jgi:hypothetical protein